MFYKYIYLMRLYDNKNINIVNFNQNLLRFK